MIAFAVRRILQGFVVILVLIVLVFLVTHSLGDPVRIMLSPGASDEVVQAMRERFGLNDPLIVQFWDYFKGIPTLNLGTSLWMGRPVTELILERFPATFILAIAAVGWATIAGAVVGVLSAVKPRGTMDRVLSFVTFFGVSSIDFWIGLMLILLVAVNLGWLPTSGYSGLKYLILPALTLGFRSFGRIAQVTRPAIIEETNKPYIMALRARGLPEIIIMSHALRNAAITIVSLVGYEFARLFCGASVVVETVFAWPGVGLLLIQAVHARDWPLIVGSCTIIAGLVIFLHLIIDLLYGVINPRVRLE